MGLKFRAQNRSNAKKDFDSAEGLKAHLRIQRNLGRLTPERELYLQQEIHDADLPVALNQFNEMWPRAKKALHRLADGKATARLSGTEQTGIRLWLDSIERLQYNHSDYFHIAQLLGGEELDPTLRKFNAAYLYLAVLSKPDEYVRRGYLDTDHRLKDLKLTKRLSELNEEDKLGRYLDRETAVPHTLRNLPDDNTDRARVFHLYAKYLELTMVRCAYNRVFHDSYLPFGYLSEDDLGKLAKPSDYIDTQVQELDRLLQDHLAGEGVAQ